MKKIIPITIFAIAMGFLEAAVVVYLRHIYYPQGFSFPLNTHMHPKILVTELSREAATIVMLLCVGIIAGGNFITKLCYFLFAFGIWDIFYYVGLKVFLNWPKSLTTWDILFLIPVPWVGPVIAPVICAFTMVFLSLITVYVDEKYKILLKGKAFDWLLAISGAFIIYITFSWDFTRLIATGGFLPKFFTLATDAAFANVVSQYKPEKFYWFPFITGELLILISFFKVWFERTGGKIK